MSIPFPRSMLRSKSLRLVGIFYKRHVAYQREKRTLLIKKKPAAKKACAVHIDSSVTGLVCLKVISLQLELQELAGL